MTYREQIAKIWFEQEFPDRKWDDADRWDRCEFIKKADAILSIPPTDAMVTAAEDVFNAQHSYGTFKTARMALEASLAAAREGK